MRDRTSGASCISCLLEVLRYSTVQFKLLFHLFLCVCATTSSYSGESGSTVFVIFHKGKDCLSCEVIYRSTHLGAKLFQMGFTVCSKINFH